MSKSMVLTLGHNASAIVVRNGLILGGYEEERFSNKKSDSSFPYQAINRLKKMYGGTYDDVCIGHWFTGGNITNNKYIDMKEIVSMSSNIHSICDGLTHHDSHMISAEVFAKHYNMPAKSIGIVADGFGTFGECISIYDLDKGSKLRARYFGYGNSLGMLYQYATAYLGMKMHNHEYKMLGYEAHISEVIEPTKIQALNEIIAVDASARLRDLLLMNIDRDLDPIVNVSALAATQHRLSNLLDGVLEALELSDIEIFAKRVVISYYVQGIVEGVILALAELHEAKNLIVSGGLFYNVKLNHRLADKVEKLCVMPLAGDQGAGLGIYQSVHGDLAWPGHLFWGHRELGEVFGDGIYRTNSEDMAYEKIANELQDRGYVNVVRGAMEFGPRSLCNTATLALPSIDVVEKINAMNDRTTIMPMAPVMTQLQADHFLKDNEKIVGSLDYMIVTRDLIAENSSELVGASHHYPMEHRTTCRPQIIRDDFMMSDLLNDFGPLINTSFNYHGVPIVFDKASIEYSHKKQNETTLITTVVIY